MFEAEDEVPAGDIAGANCAAPPIVCCPMLARSEKVPFASTKEFATAIQ